MGDVSADMVMASSDIVLGGSGGDAADKGDGKLSLRMKLVTPVEEGSSERFSLQSKNSFHAVCEKVSRCHTLSDAFLSPEPTPPEEDGSVTKVTTISQAVTR